MKNIFVQLKELHLSYRIELKKIAAYGLLGLLSLILASCQLDLPADNQPNGVRATIRTSVISGVAPLVVDFNAADSAGDIEKVSWDFADGQASEAEVVSHTFVQPGVFSVRLTVEDAAGNRDSDTITITVQNEGDNPGPDPDPNTTAPVSAGVVLPLRRAEIEQDLSNLAVDGVYFATRQSGNTQLVTTGTVTQNSNGQFSYNPEPSDLLRVVFSDGLSLEYNFTSLQGDFSQPDGERFLRKDHAVSFRLMTSEGTDVQVDLNRSNGNYQNTVRGTVVDAGIPYDLDTQTQGSILSDFGQGSVRFESQEQTTGTISRTGFLATLDETFSYKLVVFDKAADDIRHTFNNTWTIGADQFELANATIFRTFSDGLPVEFDSWLASGTLTRNGQAIGGFSQEQAITSIDTMLTADGEKTIIFSDQTF